MLEELAESRRDEERRRADEYIALSRRMAEMKNRMEELKGWFEARGLQDLNATKIKTVDYWGGDGKIEVGRSETVTPVALVALRKIFGTAYDELVKPKSSIEMTAACKQLLGPICAGNYIDTPIADIIAAAAPDEKTREALRRKLRGNFKTDRAALRNIAGLDDGDADYYAYMAAESVAYDRFRKILTAGGWTGTVKEAIDIAKAAVIVEDGVKVTVERPKD